MKHPCNLQIDARRLANGRQFSPVCSNLKPLAISEQNAYQPEKKYILKGLAPMRGYKSWLKGQLDNGRPAVAQR